MKKYIYIWLAAASLMMGTTACSDFLEEDNKTGQTADLTYNTKTGIEGLVDACYSFSRGWWGKEAGLGLAEMGSDLFYYGYDNKQKTLNSYNLTSASLDGNASDNACLDHYWELFYCAIDVCNNALNWIPQCTAISDADREKYLGEVYFLRALYNLQMVSMWGPIPYNETAFVSTKTTATRMPEEQVYSNILADIDAAMQHLKAGGLNKKSDGASGQANYYAAAALKARTLLYAASWLGAQSLSSNPDYAGKNLYQLAQTAAEEVITGSGASFYDNYEDTWSMNNEDINVNKEAIWGVYYDSDLKTPVNCLPKRFKTNASGSQLDYVNIITRTGYSRGGSAMLLMFVSMWNNGCTDIGNNKNDQKSVFIRSTSESTSYLKSKSTGKDIYVADHYSPYGRGFTRYLPSMYLWNLLEAGRETDQRTEATLLSAYTIASPDLAANVADKYPLMKDTAIYYSPLDGDSPEGKAMQEWAKGRYRIQFMSGGDIPVYTSNNAATAVPTEAPVATSSVYGDKRYDTYKVAGWCSFPGIKKFLDNVYDSNFPTHDISYRDHIVFRLAEMYLIKAEAQLGQNNASGALTTINELRAKRAISGKDNKISGTVDINTILDERAIELCGEQQRWFDLKRTHTLIDRVKKYNAQASGNIKEMHYYRPIPEAQILSVTNFSGEQPSASNGVINYTTELETFWQNPGY